MENSVHFGPLAVSKPPQTTEVLLNRRRSVRPCMDLVDLQDNGLLKGWKRSFALVIKPRHSISAPVGIKVVYSPPPIKCDCSFINHFRVSPWYNILINELFEAAAWNGRLVSGYGPPSLIKLKNWQIKLGKKVCKTTVVRCCALLLALSFLCKETKANRLKHPTSRHLPRATVIR